MTGRRSPSPSRDRKRSTSPRRERSSRDDREHRDDRRGGGREGDSGARESFYRERDRDHTSSRDRKAPDGPSRERPTPSEWDRPRSRSPPARNYSRRPKELSFYKKGGPSVGSLSAQRDPLEVETEKERMQRKELGEVPARFGGTREQGVRNTMTLNPNLPSGGASVGSLGRKTDPLDRLSGSGKLNGGGNADKAREQRMAAMGQPQAVAPAAAGAR
jgi:hypothetical protein